MACARIQPYVVGRNRNKYGLGQLRKAGGDVAGACGGDDVMYDRVPAAGGPLVVGAVAAGKNEHATSMNMHVYIRWAIRGTQCAGLRDFDGPTHSAWGHLCTLPKLVFSRQCNQGAAQQFSNQRRTLADCGTLNCGVAKAPLHYASSGIIRCLACLHQIFHFVSLLYWLGYSQTL
jgi:hypothetical protein